VRYTTALLLGDLGYQVSEAASAEEALGEVERGLAPDLLVTDHLMADDFEPADAEDLTAPILPSERGYRLDHRDVGRSARLDMQKALDLAVKSRERVR
ncbi:peptidase S8 and S53 subtilisin kexin sedolisin, partial [Pseudomonas aeruginosa]